MEYHIIDTDSIFSEPDPATVELPLEDPEHCRSDMRIVRESDYEVIDMEVKGVGTLWLALNPRQTEDS